MTHPTVLSLLAVHPKDQPLFFGEPLSLQRFDNPRYPIFNKLTDDQDSFFWRPRDVNLTADRTSVSTLTESEHWVWRQNLMFQIMGDSMLSRSINAIIAKCTNSSLEACLQMWAAFETIHSRSYTWILDNAIPDTSQFYDDVMNNQEIVNRAMSLKAKFDALLGESKDERQNLFNAVVAAQVMEGLTFYVSFACSFYFAARGKMVGNGNIIQLIARDENLHVAITQNILRIWRNFPHEGMADIVKNSHELVVEAYRIGVQAEKDWAAYLFSKGNLVGLTAAGMNQFSEYLANNRLVNLGKPRLFAATTNPFSGWIDPYFNSMSNSPMPQETEVTAYAKTASNDLGDSAYDDL